MVEEANVAGISALFASSSIFNCDEDERQEARKVQKEGDQERQRHCKDA